MAISLDEMLRDYQRNAVDAILALPPGSRRLYVAPCGTGKSYVEVAVQRARPDSLIVTPRTEIADGMVEKGADPARIYTPITLRNRMMDQRVGSPSLLLCDEAHHDTCDTAETIRLCCNADTTIIGFTATPYRGSPLGTRALRELYGEPHYILTLTAAIQRGLCVVPQCATIPILDDDIVTIQNGEFSVQGVGKHTPWQDAAEMIRTYWQAERRPTVVSLPSVQSCQVMQDLCQVPTCIITGETPALGRANGFRRCMDGDAVLLQVQVVSEGVDLHLRRLIDLAPTQSPTRWLQQVGRVMRPVGESEYICTNRNLLRHGYLLEGVLPVEALQSAQLAFPTVSKRSGSRAFGLEGLGKLRPAGVPLANGLTGSIYYVSRLEGFYKREYAAIVLPQSPDVVWTTRSHVQKSGRYGTWERCEPPHELRGFQSVPPGPLTQPQLNWWQRDARKYGLDPQAEVDRKTFGVLPVLAHLKLRIQ